MEAVEAMPADVRLTKAVTLLGDALNAVADFVDGVDALPAATTPAGEPQCVCLMTSSGFRYDVVCPVHDAPVPAVPAPADPDDVVGQLYIHEAQLREAAEKQLGDLLAIIHRDGGQYQREHGTEKAVADAIQRVEDARTPLAPADAPRWTREQVEQIALRYHKADRPVGEGEYGCPGVSCPGVQRLTNYWFNALSFLAAAPSGGARLTSWEPMATAPKDGKVVVLAWPSGMVSSGYWSMAPHIGWITPHGLYAGSHQPTIWQPLPLPPTPTPQPKGEK